MAIVSKVIEVKEDNITQQRLIVSAECNPGEEPQSYDDISIVLYERASPYITVKCDITKLLQEAGVFISIVDSINWQLVSRKQAHI